MEANEAGVEAESLARPEGQSQGDEAPLVADTAPPAENNDVRAEAPLDSAGDAGGEAVADPAPAETADEPQGESSAAATVEEAAPVVDAAPATPAPAGTAAGAQEDGVAAATVDEAAPAAEATRAAASEAPAPPTPFQRGEVIDGTVSSTSPTEVRMDLGEGHEGVIPGRELERMQREQIEQLQPGAVIPVYVVNPHDHEGNIRLSVTHAQEELDWRKAEACHKSQEVFESLIAGYNKGGLIVRFGLVRGFVPQSQIGNERRSASGSTPQERWGGMVNEPIAVKVIEVDRSRNRLILSERAAAREQRESRKERLVQELRVGEAREGRVVSLVDFGAFVDIGGAEGLVHLTEISWQHVNHPRDALKVGDEVRVEVISVDRERKRIGLSIRRQAADPWDTVAIDYKVGQLVQGLVTKLTNFGAFARLVAAPEIEGLIHISELSEQRISHPRDVVKEGETLTLRVVKMDVAARRLGLSLKAVNSAEYLDQDWLS
ncbi:MAG: S1 RNA-binding domain-containing protein [Anaerolineaceae bacterium]|nr:S1 RNA-binding domain-containing protein [Anaerolineaceae bacterium]